MQGKGSKTALGSFLPSSDGTLPISYSSTARIQNFQFGYRSGGRYLHGDINIGDNNIHVHRSHRNNGTLQGITTNLVSNIQMGSFSFATQKNMKTILRVVGFPFLFGGFVE